MATISEQAAAAVEKLVDEHEEWAAAIGRNVHRALPPSFDAGDLEQVARIETWRQAQAYDPANARGTPFRAFAYQAVRGAVLMSVRRRAYTDNTCEELDPTAFSDSPRPDEIVAARQHQKNVAGPQLYRQKVWLSGAIDKLKGLDAFLVKRIYIMERDVEETAKLFGMEKRAVSRRLAGIVKRLKRQLIVDQQKARQRRRKRRRRK